MSSNPLNSSSLFNVAGKRALVTGGGSGIGEMMATTLVSNGAHVLIASRKLAQLQSVSEKLNTLGPGTCSYIVADIGSKAGCDKLVAEVGKRWDSLQILVNNSGTTWGAKWEDFPEDKGWDRILGTNVKALFYVTVGLTPLLEKGATNLSPGRVINVSSVAGLDPKADNTHLGNPGEGVWSYNTSKAAANHLTKTMAVTLARKKITVNAILPGVFPSKMTAFGMSNHDLSVGQPMGRVGTIEDMGGLLLFLTSRASAHITGVLIPIDGGALISGAGYSGAEKL